MTCTALASHAALDSRSGFAENRACDNIFNHLGEINKTKKTSNKTNETTAKCLKIRNKTNKTNKTQDICQNVNFTLCPSVLLSYFVLFRNYSNLHESYICLIFFLFYLIKISNTKRKIVLRKATNFASEPPFGPTRMIYHKSHAKSLEGPSRSILRHVHTTDR